MRHGASETKRSACPFALPFAAAGGRRVTVEDARLEASATLVAVIVTLVNDATAGAVYSPEPLSVPRFGVRDQVTADGAPFRPPAVNCCDSPAASDAAAGRTPIAAGSEIRTVAAADLPGSATLVAVM